MASGLLRASFDETDSFLIFWSSLKKCRSVKYWALGIFLSLLIGTRQYSSALLISRCNIIQGIFTTRRNVCWFLKFPSIGTDSNSFWQKIGNVCLTHFWTDFNFFKQHYHQVIWLPKQRSIYGSYQINFWAVNKLVDGITSITTWRNQTLVKHGHILYLTYSITKMINYQHDVQPS